MTRKKPKVNTHKKLKVKRSSILEKIEFYLEVDKILAYHITQLDTNKIDQYNKISKKTTINRSMINNKL